MINQVNSIASSHSQIDLASNERNFIFRLGNVQFKFLILKKNIAVLEWEKSVPRGKIILQWVSFKNGTKYLLYRKKTMHNKPNQMNKSS